MGFLDKIKLAGANKVAPPNQSSLNAKGLVPVPDTSPEMGSSLAVTIREVVPELVSPYQRNITYSRMKNDVAVSTSMKAAKAPILGAEFYLDPASSDPNDQIVAEFINANLFGGTSAPFANAITDILEMFEDGYAAIEKVFELRQWSPNATGANTKTYTMLKKLAYRPASTITDIAYDDNGGPAQLTQNAIRADKSVEEVQLTIDRLVIFTNDRKGGDITGKSLLRTAYQSWFYKNWFYKIDAIQKERHGIGVPIIRLMAGFKQKDVDAALKLVKNLRTNEEAGVVLPPNMQLEFAELHGNLVDVMSSADHHNHQILLNVMVQFLMMGATGSSGGGGSRAAGGTQSDIFMKSLRYVADLICDYVNMFLIPELVVYNFATTNFPSLKVRNIGETRDLQMLGSALANMAAQNVFIPDEASEAWTRKIFDMPARTTPRPEVTNTQDQTNQNGAKKGNVVQNGGSGNVGKPTNAPQ